MRKLPIGISLVTAVVVGAIISFSIVLAQGNERDDSNASKLAIAVAEILGLDKTVVDDAIRQAREEFKDEAIQEKLNSLVEKGLLTQEQANEYLDGIQSRPVGIPEIGKHGFGKWGRHKGWKSRGDFFGSRNYFIGKPSYEDIQKKLNTMVKDGDITQGEAEAKLKDLQAAKAKKAASF